MRGERQGGKTELGELAVKTVQTVPALLQFAHLSRFLSSNPPFTVERLRLRPPCPITPLMRRGPQRPLMVSGNSVDMLPFTVEASTSTLASAGRSRVMPPLTVENSRPEEHTSETQP